MSGCNCESWVRIDGGRKLPDIPENLALGQQAARAGLKVEFYAETGPLYYDYRSGQPALRCGTCTPLEV